MSTDPLGLRPVSDAELQSYRDANRGMLSNAYHAATNWVKHNWEYLAAGAMVVAGGVMMATGVGGPAGMALISAGISTGMQKYQHGSVNWGHVAIDGAIGLVTAGIGGAAATGAKALTEGMSSCLGRNMFVGAADGMTSGASYNALNYLTSDGPKSVGGFLKTTAAGGASGLAIGGPLGGLTKVAGAACFVADTQVLMGDGSSKTIQDVQVGDEVLAWNPATDQNEPRRVVETFVHEDVETWEVETADGQVVTSTAEHPFWVEGKGWTPVRELATGDVLATADGSATVLRVEPTGESARVFNVHVEGLRNYHVQQAGLGLRVHNRCFTDQELDQMVTRHVTDSGTTVLGHFPQYISKAERLGASYFSVGDDWDAVAKQVDPFKRLNIPFLENRMAAGGRMLLSVPKQKIRPDSALASEVEHLTKNGYKWVNQWALIRKVV